MKYRKGKWCVYPIEYVSGIDSLAQTLFSWMCRFADDDGKSFPSINKLREKTGIKSKNTINDKIKILENIGLIKKTKYKKSNGEYRNNVYQIIIPDESNNDLPGSPDDLGVGQQEFDKNTIHTNKYTIVYNEDGTPIESVNSDVIPDPLKEKEKDNHGKFINSIITRFRHINPAVTYVHRGHRRAIEDLINLYGEKEVEEIMDAVESIQNDRFAPVIVTPMDMWTKLAQLKKHLIRKENE